MLTLGFLHAVLSLLPRWNLVIQAFIPVVEIGANRIPLTFPETVCGMVVLEHQSEGFPDALRL